MTNTVAIRTTVPPLSQSRRALMACSHLYHARVIGGLEEAPNEAALRGTELHEAASYYVNYLVSRRLKSDPEWFANNVLSRPYRTDTLELLEASLRAGHFDIDPERVLGTEMYLALNEALEPIEFDPSERTQDGTIEAPEPLTAHEGTLDRVDIISRSAAVIHDYKSQFAIVDAEDHYQALHYSFLLFKHYPALEEVTFVLHFVRYGAATRQVTYRRSEDLAEMETAVKRERAKQLLLHHNALEQQATPGKACTYCPLRNKLGGNGITDRGCPIAALNPYVEMSPEDRARYHIYLLSQVKENKRILRDFCDLAPIRVEDGNGTVYSVGFQKQEKATYPIVDVMPLIIANDPDLAQKLNISGLSSPLKAKKRAQLRELVEEKKGVKISSKFTVSGVEDDDEEYTE